MTDWLNLAMLICALMAALAFGVFSAYGILRLAFFLMRPAPRSAVKPKPAMARSLP